MKNQILLTLLILLHTTAAHDIDINSDQVLRIAQISDLLLSNQNSDNEEALNFLHFVVQEERPDLVVFTGDTVETSVSLNQFHTLFTQVAENLTAAGVLFYQPINQVHWISTGGSSMEWKQRDNQSRFDQSFENSFTQNQNEDPFEFGFYTAKLDVKYKKQVLYKIWVLDTFSWNSCYDWENQTICMSKKPVQWFRDQMASQKSANSQTDLIFVYDPPQEMKELLNFWEVNGYRYQPVCCQPINSGIFATALESQKVALIASGKDCNNDFHGTFQSIHLTNAKKSGVRGCGEIGRGARIFQVEYFADSVELKTWIRGIDSQVDKQERVHYPAVSGYAIQRECCQDPYKGFIY